MSCLAYPQHPDVKLCYRKLFLGRGQHCHVGFNDARLGSEVCTLKVGEGSDVCWSCCEGTMTSSLETAMRDALRAHQLRAPARGHVHAVDWHGELVLRAGCSARSTRKGQRSR